jgi:deoxyribodipyrimidine photo-lyase
MYKKSVFIFHRDLRLDDNTGLIEALKNSELVLPIFIFDSRQVTNNPYKSSNCVQFMIASLEDLDNQLDKKGSGLKYFYGLSHLIVQKIINEYEIDAVYYNRDYTRFALTRDEEIMEVCKKKGVMVHSPEDYLLLPMGTILTGGGLIYSKFTPYFMKAKSEKVSKVSVNKYNNYWNIGKKMVSGEIDKDAIHKYYKKNDNILAVGGRDNVIKKLGEISMGNFGKYNENRDNPSIETTQLSAYIKFGCISIREVYWKFRDTLGTKNDLIKQLYWREFYYNIGYGFPQIYLSKSLKPKYDELKWIGSNIWLNKWKEGITGFPIVDAGMRQMNTTGFMHNRLRLITSNFLIKICGIDWREGEKYFAQTLYDYDWAVNNGNWQWGAGSGSDSQPYFRIFNPWIQSKTHDPDGIYIKKWIPELVDVDNKDLHKWDISSKKYSNIKYPIPMLDYNEQKLKVLDMYGKLF